MTSVRHELNNHLTLCHRYRETKLYSCNYDNLIFTTYNIFRTKKFLLRITGRSYVTGTDIIGFKIIFLVFYLEKQHISGDPVSYNYGKLLEY